MHTTTTITLDAIRTDGGTQPRADLDLALCEEYRAALEEGATFPPVVVFYDGVERWIADGFHRLAAHRLAGRETIEAVVHQGTVRDAQLWSFGANDEHGKRRTNADKRRAVEAMLRDSEWAAWSDREIARRCKVTHPFVAKLRASLVTVTSERTVTRAGVTFTMDTSAIGMSEARALAEAIIDAPIPLVPGAHAVADTASESWLVLLRESERDAGFYWIGAVQTPREVGVAEPGGQSVATKRPVRADMVRAYLLRMGVPIGALEWLECEREAVRWLGASLKRAPWDLEWGS
ncbi:MAG: hypothetical protein M5U28_36055 [Sandaracinaceae bacterium]|nr:hypothetical protein [Sandaracinaceae bacterium]